VLGIFTNNHDATFALDDFALVAHLFDRRSDFHFFRLLNDSVMYHDFNLLSRNFLRKKTTERCILLKQHMRFGNESADQIVSSTT